jgi:hypothetical protein
MSRERRFRLRAPRFALLSCLLALTPPARSAPPTAPRLPKLPRLADAPPAVEPISAGDASGPFAAAVGEDGRLHLVYGGRDGTDAPRLRYRAQVSPGAWEKDAETLLDRAPARVALAAPAWGPVAAWIDGGAAHVARRGAAGWTTRLVAEPGLRPGPLAFVAEGHALRLLIACAGPVPVSGTLATAPFLRRLRLDPDGTEIRSDLPLPDPGSGPVVLLAAAAAPSASDHLAIIRAVPAGRLLRIGGDGALDPQEVTTLGYTRLGDGFLPVAVLPTAGKVAQATLARLDEGFAVAWTSLHGERTRVLFQPAQAGRLQGAETLLDEAVPVDGLAADGRGSTVVVAVVVGKPGARRLRLKWYDGAFWSEWLEPPGAERERGHEPLVVAVLLDRDRRAHLVAQERPVLGDGPRRIVEWLALPGR